MSIQIKSFNQILGDMIRKIIAETPLNDINAGSVLLSLLEACASNDFENNTAILNVLELLNIDALKNNDLDARAGDYGLTRNSAVKASGQVTIYNSNITKRSTGLYVIKPAPIAGQTVIYVNNANGWSLSGGSLYLGRGTDSFEGPITYTSIDVYPTYAAINLSSALQKDHLISDSVIDSQGETDKLIPAGTILKIPANNQNPEILYSTLRDAVIPAGEDHVNYIDVIARAAGSVGNAQINTITQFDSVPFTGATVSNTSSFSNGADVETDVQLRNRIKSYSITLARGTAPSIIQAVLGVSDPDDSKQVASAVITEPVRIGDPSIMYIDDGSGFQPEYQGQSVDILLSNAEGSEEFLQLANYPVPRPQVVNVAEGPFNLVDNSFLRVIVDGEEETIFFTSLDFLNISAATVAEIIIAINKSSKLFKARFNNQSANILLYPVVHNVETLQVAPIRATDNPLLYVNSTLKFPTTQVSYISLYQNSAKLHEKAKSAQLETTPFAVWNITTSGNLVISVDNTPAQDRLFVLSDFVGASSFASLTLEDWVAAMNSKFAGITVEATPNQTMKITSNKEGEGSSIVVGGSTYFEKWFSNLPTSSVGQAAQFELNRQTGNLRILTDISVGDSISAGVEDAKGFVVSVKTTSGTFNVSNDTSGRPAEVVIVTDAQHCNQKSLSLLVGGSIAITDQGGSIMRLTSNTLDMFATLLPGDFIYITKKTSGWVSNANAGLYKLVSKGDHVTAGTDSYIEVLNDTIVPETVSIADSQDVKAFSTDGYPQIWRGSYVANPPAEPIDGIVNSLNKDVIGVKASIFRSNSVKVTSTTENGGSIAIPVVNGNASVLFVETKEKQDGNQSHVANRVSDKSLVSFFKKTPATGLNVPLNRQVASEVKGSLTANSVPDQSPYSGTYSETIESTGVLTSSIISPDDIIAFTKGNNRGQARSIKALISGDKVGTQQGVARTEFDHIVGDEFEVMRPLQISSDDSVVVVMDKDPTVKTVDIKLARTGRVNSGSDSSTFLPTSTEFSANDYDNEPNIDFSSATVWDKVLNNTDFSDYAVWMRARNWYASGGTASANGKMLIRSAQYGPNGEKLRFSLEYPTNPDQANAVTYLNTPSYSTLSYFFGAGPQRTAGISSSDTIAVAGPYPDTSTNFPSGAPSTGNYYDYTFSGGTLSSVVVGDVLSIISTSGVSTFNRGQFSVVAKSGNTVRVMNPNGSATSPGAPEVTTVQTIADVLGTPASFEIETVADVAGSLSGKYFIIQDSAGSVAVWFDVDNSGIPEPTHGADRSIKIATVLSDDSADIVAQNIYNVLNYDGAFSATAVGDTVTAVCKQNGVLSAGSAGTSGFAVAYTAGTDDDSLNRRWFTIYDDIGSVAVWFDIGNNGSQEPFHGDDRSIRVSTVNAGDNADTVAAAVAAAVNADIRFTASASSDIVTITAAFNGNTSAATANNSGFTVSSVDGSLSTSEVIVNANGVFFFPLVNNTVNDIATLVNEGNVLSIVAISAPSATISKSTKEDMYVYAGNATALAYDHTPSIGYVKLYDGQNWVKTFNNSNPNFIMKVPFVLNGVSAIYSMNTCPNPDIADLGELFKLIPKTVKNVYHHLTQKALSQLPIVSNIDISNDRKNVQIKSKQLGSDGSVEVIGGSGNKAQLYVTGESEIASDGSGSYLLVKVPSFPDTFNVGDYVQLQNDSGVKRDSRLLATDEMSVSIPIAGFADYNYSPKDTNINSSTQFTITDVSGTYGKPSNTVWRWTHGGGGATFSQVVPGDVLAAYGTLSGWSQGNKAGNTGENEVAGLPIIAVNDNSNWVDVINPHGRTMTSTSVGASSAVKICPTPIIKWNLDHANATHIISLVRVSGTVTAICSEPHYLNTGDSVIIKDSDNIADGVISPITVTSLNTFTFSAAGSDFTEGDVNASVISSSKTPTRYKIEKLGYNNLARLSRVDGQSPRFVDCGVALDDYLVIAGNTFNNNNNGRFRVLALDNDSLVFQNEQVSEELNTIITFNNKLKLANWVSNLNIVSGTAGTFKNVMVGDWVKKSEDDDTYYNQVVSINTGVPSTATQIVLGAPYKGSTSTAEGVSYREDANFNKGVYLRSTNDITIFEGDSAVAGDTLSIQNIINSNWFGVTNIGNFSVAEVGTSGSTYEPFIRVNNAAATAESNRQLSVNPSGVYVTEGLANKFYSIRQITNIAIDDINEDKRAVYISHFSGASKFSNANSTSISHIGKLGYNTDVTTGIDGYLYYTGLLRRVQRIVDGYEPDSENFPGRRAVGGAIEILPPLIKRITLSINVTTNDGVNLGDISNNIKSVIINYVQALSVGQDVILSEIIAQVMQIKGVAAVTFTNPVPSQERITIADNEKATIVPENIGIA